MVKKKHMAPRRKQKSRASRRHKATRSATRRPLIATRILNGLLTRKFPYLRKPLLDLDRGVQQQMDILRVHADAKAKEVRVQMEKMLLEIAQRVRKNLQNDLKKVEVALRDLATRVSKLERNIKQL